MALAGELYTTEAWVIQHLSGGTPMLVACGPGRFHSAAVGGGGTGFAVGPWSPAGRAWTWIALAVLLMAARRGVVLYRLAVGDLAAST